MSNKRYTIFTDPNTVVQQGDRIILTPSKCVGEAPPVSRRKFIKAIKKLGFYKYQNGPGDHTVWSDEHGTKLTINPHNRDKKCVDHASVKSLAKLLEQNFGDVLDDIRNENSLRAKK